MPGHGSTMGGGAVFGPVERIPTAAIFGKDYKRVFTVIHNTVVIYKVYRNERV